MTRIECISLINRECEYATSKFYKLNSTHEGYAVLKEEVDELWDVIKKNGTSIELKNEAIQVGAMAIRFLMDCC